MDAWRETCDIKTFADPKRIHLRPGKGRNGNRNVLQVLLPFLSDHDHLFEHALGLSSGAK